MCVCLCVLFAGSLRSINPAYIYSNAPRDNARLNCMHIFVIK